MNMENHQLTKRERRELLQQEKMQKEDQTKKSRKIKKRIKIISIIIAVIGIGMIFWFTSNKTTVPTNELLTVVSDDWAKGNKDAPVTIIEYLDFECEACGAYYPLVKRLSQEYGDKVSFVTRYFPLPGHRNSMTSALAVESAGKQGKYWEMYDTVFENQSLWGEKETPEPTIFEGYAQQLGLDMEKFRQDINSQEVKDRIERDKNTGNKLGIEGTPTFFLNGKRIENPRGYEEFKKILDNALKN
jgi:protein-disulfide isomerase